MNQPKWLMALVENTGGILVGSLIGAVLLFILLVLWFNLPL